MNSSASLLGLTVKDYFNLCSWQLSPPPINNNLPKQAKVIPPQRPRILPALSVKEFFNSCNWQLLPQNELENDKDSTSPLLPPQEVESDRQKPAVGLPCLTVAEFFSLCNWQSLPPAIRTQPLLTEPESPLPESPLEPKPPLACQVQTFLQMISWEGSPEIGRLPQASAKSHLVSPSSTDMNLNDLSKLF